MLTFKELHSIHIPFRYLEPLAQNDSLVNQLPKYKSWKEHIESRQSDQIQKSCSDVQYKYRCSDLYLQNFSKSKEIPGLRISCSLPYLYTYTYIIYIYIFFFLEGKGGCFLLILADTLEVLTRAELMHRIVSKNPLSVPSTASVPGSQIQIFPVKFKGDL